MNSLFFSSPFKSLQAPVFSPRWFFVRGAFLLSLYLIMELLGYRDYTCVICGTSPTGNTADQMALIQGMVFVLLYFGATMAAPVFLLSAFFSRLFLGMMGYRPHSRPPV